MSEREVEDSEVSELVYATDRSLTPEQFKDVLERSTLGQRRPIDNPEIMAAMVANADLTVTAWDGDVVIGVARSVTDFAYCCYLSDLAVDTRYQRRGVGVELMRRTRTALGPRCMMILLAAPAAVDYYPRIGFTRHDSAWILRPTDSL